MSNSQPGTAVTLARLVRLFCFGGLSQVDHDRMPIQSEFSFVYLLSSLPSHCNHVENVHDIGTTLSIIRIIIECFYTAPRLLLALHGSDTLLIALQCSLVELWIIRRQLDVPL